VFFSKGGDGLDVLSEAKQRCEFLVAQDEEVGPALSRAEVEHYWRPPRYSGPAIELIDRLFVFSEAHLDVLAEVSPTLAAKASVTGWSRVDLWREEGRAPDERQSQLLRERHGRFVLFVANYKVNTEQQRLRKIEFGREEHERVPATTAAHRSVYSEFGTNATHRYESYQRAARLLTRIAQSMDDLHLIVRPHPAEDPETWRDALRDAPGASVIFEGEVGPWVLASQAMLHTGCTTVVQAWHYGVPCGYLAEVGYLPDTAAETIPFRLSTYLSDMPAVERFLEAVQRDQATDAPAGQVSEAEMGSSDGRASQRIADHIAELPVTPEPPLPIGPADAVRSRIRGGSGTRFFGTAAQPKSPDGLHAREARRLVEELPIDRRPLVREELFNLLRIEPA